MTIHELAAAAGMTVRNVRAYRTKGLLAGPLRQGRRSVYGAGHLERLLQVQVLRDAGVPLQMIAEAVQAGTSLGPDGPLLALVSGQQRADTAPEVVRCADLDPHVDRLVTLGVTPSAVLVLALRTAHAGVSLAAELTDDVLSTVSPTGNRELGEAVADLAGLLTRESVAQALAPRAADPPRILG